MYHNTTQHKISGWRSLTSLRHTGLYAWRSLTACFPFFQTSHMAGDWKSISCTMPSEHTSPKQGSTTPYHRAALQATQKRLYTSGISHFSVKVKWDNGRFHYMHRGKLTATASEHHHMANTASEHHHMANASVAERPCEHERSLTLCRCLN